jgi:HAD superfamily hydrolase (TIGR01484 family)
MIKRRQTLATDLDGTLIPLDGVQKNIMDLGRLKKIISERNIQLIFVTGRHLESVRSAIEDHQLPQPEHVICDVGTSIYQLDSNNQFKLNKDYVRELHEILSPNELQDFGRQLRTLSGLRRQEPHKQGPFKLSYYCDAARLSEFANLIQRRIQSETAPVQLIASVDPFNHDGLIDLLPQDVSKAFALAWWVQSSQTIAEGVVFAGDSGNDLAALTAGYRTIVVGNADGDLMDAVKMKHRQLGFIDRLFIADEQATSGVLEGCRHWNIG